jgi:hypothetical protein
MDYRDIIVCAGLAVVAAGIALWSKAAALIFCGVCVALLGLFTQVKQRED